MKSFYLLIICLFLNGCQSHQVANYEKIADRITAETAHKIESETGLRLIGVGGGMMDHVRMMAMSFECLGEITTEQGRELLICCIHEYLSAINANKEIRPYLIHYPFMPNDLQIRIFIYNIDQKDVPIGSLSAVAAINGVLDYDIHQVGFPVFKQIHEETYEEAIKMLEMQPFLGKIRKNGRST